MSYLKHRIGNATPDASGDLTVGLGDLTGVDTSSISDGEVLSYSASTGWRGASPPSASATAVIGWGSTSASYSLPSHSVGVNDNAVWHNNYFSYENSALVSRVSASGSLVPFADANFTQYFTLKASGLQGKVIDVRACYIGGNVSSSTEAFYQWGTGSGNLSTFTPIGAVAHQCADYTQTAFGSFVMGSSDTNLALKVVDRSGYNKAMYSSDVKFCFLTITAS